MDEVESRGVKAVGKGAEALCAAEEEGVEGEEEGEGEGGRVERKAEMSEGEEREMGRGVSMLEGVSRCSIKLWISVDVKWDLAGQREEGGRVIFRRYGSEVMAVVPLPD